VEAIRLIDAPTFVISTQEGVNGIENQTGMIMAKQGRIEKQSRISWYNMVLLPTWKT
jgi:hypothetical protein